METQLTAARGLIGVLGGIFILGILAWLGFWVYGEVEAQAKLKAPPPPPPPPTELQRNTCWLKPSTPGCAEVLRQTGPPPDPVCPLGGADQGNWSDGRRCTFEGQTCPPGSTCGSMFNNGQNIKYYLGNYQEEAKPPPELPPTSIKFGLYDNQTTLTSLQHTDAGLPYDIPALYPANAVSSSGALCIKDPSQPGCPPTDERGLCCSRAPPGQCVEGCPTNGTACEGEKIPYAVFHHESCGGSELVHTVNPGTWDMDHGI